MKLINKKTEPSSSEGMNSKLSKSTKNSKYLGGLTILIIILLIGRYLLTGSAPVQKANTVEPKITTASAATPLNLNVPDLSESQASALSAPPSPPQPPVKIQETPSQPAKSDEQWAMAFQNEQTRLKSPTMIYGEEAKPGEATRGALPTGGTVGMDINSAFAQQAANAPVIKVSAKRDTNVNYKILQGKLIAAVLETSIHSDMPGMVRAVVSKDVYSDTGEVVLLPRGTRLIGQYNSAVAMGQTRVMVVWTRAITPQHVDIALGSPNTDNLGQAGMGGDVDTHFWQIFGNSALLSILGVTASNASMGPSGNTVGAAGNPYQAAVAQGVLNASGEVLQNRINLKPTIYVNQGSAIQVFVARDLDFSGLLRRFRQ